MQCRADTGFSHKRGLKLVELAAANFELGTHKGLLIKDSYWRWPERNLAPARRDH